MAKKLFVGNLSFSVGSEGLEEIFNQFGTVQSANVIVDRETGRSKGFGFVEMADDASADEAIQQLNGRSVEGRNISVSEARPQAPRDRFNGPRGGNGGGFRGNRY